MRTNRHVLYRMYSEVGKLLYVGISARPADRLSTHKRVQGWWTAVARIDLEHFLTEEEARNAETAAILAEKPAFNIQKRLGRDSTPRTLQIGPEWDEFTAIVGKMNRSYWICSYMEAVVNAPTLWREFRALAKVRGTDFAGALGEAMDLYIDNR